MIIQLGALLQPLLQAGLAFGGQFLERELGRGARRDQKNLLKAQARAAGGGASFVDAQSPGTVSSAFRTPPPLIQAQPAGLVAGMGQVFRGGLGGVARGAMGRAGPVLRRVGPEFAAGAAGAVLGSALNGDAGTGQILGGAAFGSTSSRFVLDKVEGCLRLKMPGDSGPTFKVDRNGDFVRVKPRRINPFNKSAAKRASRRIDATINAMADLVRVSKKRDKGKSVGDGQVVSFRTKKRRKRA